MSIARKLTPNTRFSSLSLDKSIKSRKNLSKPTPKLWPDDVKRRTLITNDEEVDELTLAHPILRRLESSNSIREFNQAHAQLVVTRLSQHSLATSRAVKKLCSLREVARAASFFRCTQEPDAFLCNTIMRAYVNMNDACSAMRFYYDEMVGNDVSPNHYTFPIVVKGFVGIGSLTEGEKVHGRVLKLGFDSDLFVRNALIHMYSVFRKAGSARLVFDAGPVLDLVSWNSMIDGHVKNGEVDVARELFDEMTERDVFSWNSMIAGYVARGDMGEAQWLFDRMPLRDIVSWNCMIDGCARIGNVSEARRFFDSMPFRNVVSWNTLLALYVRVKGYTECLSLFDSMLQEEEIKPNRATLVSVLTACANTGDLNTGHLVSSYMKDNDIEADTLLLTALLTMYAKCGTMDLARKVFDQMPDRSVVSWNAMIMGYGIHGHGGKALEMFLEMEKRGPMPNDATFVSIFSACTHSGMVLEGWWCFNLMSRVYKIQPKVEHYGCMVDLLARAGLVKDSGELIKEVPTEAGSSLWGALLSACRTHSHIELGEMVAKRLIELEPTDVGPYVLLSNMYAAEGNWVAVKNVRMMMKAKGLHKEVGSSLIQLGGVESTESAKDGMHHQRSMIYTMLSEIGSQIKASSRDSTAVEDRE
ncbi:pentatricopeptide repeat-containing protein At4g18840-like [Rhodamnia argentea]|uniref:Pentatricopeptide repeat-containing protein At4g18840-like n=1 Tax=Rhodamnia argentea TaxID=178133 RepID=A0A8B8PGK6_9MYRT|nr:pentatricopeptide repeat-containing protein At4g18840-like [Rhodamnia argentea]